MPISISATRLPSGSRPPGAPYRAPDGDLSRSDLADCDTVTHHTVWV